jgi:iron complex outermembrane receptor protein
MGLFFRKPSHFAPHLKTKKVRSSPIQTFTPKFCLYAGHFPYVRVMKTLLSCLLFVVSLGLQAQIQIKVMDQVSNLPLANVRVSTGGIIQTSNATGTVNFAGEKLRLLFSLEGYERLEQTFQAGEYTVALVPSVLNLAAVTVSAFESERPLIQQAASISRLSERDLFRFNENSPVQAFNQKAGIRIEERAPASYRISIRGSSLRSPFGVRNVKVYWNEVPFTSPDGTTALNLLDLSNIKTAEVIKGPSGSVYGAGNGGGACRGVPAGADGRAQRRGPGDAPEGVHTGS